MEKSAVQIFTNKGVFAVLPGNKKTKSIVATIHNKFINNFNFESNNVDEELLVRELLPYVKDLKNLKLIHKHPLNTVRLNKRFSKNNLLLGNSSQLLHPFAAQCFNFALDCIKKLDSDGVLVSTPAGSTAYNLSVHGPILSLNSKKLSIAPISPFRPRRWKGKIVNDKLKIVITNLNPSKRPISAVADNHEVRNAKSIIVKTNNKIKFNLLYDKNRSLQKKIKIEQLRGETT